MQAEGPPHEQRPPLQSAPKCQDNSRPFSSRQFTTTNYRDPQSEITTKNIMTNPSNSPTTRAPRFISALALSGMFGCVQFLFLFIETTPLAWLLADLFYPGLALVPAITLLSTRKVSRLPPLQKYFTLPISLYIAGILSTLAAFPPATLTELHDTIFNPSMSIHQFYGTWGVSAIICWVGRLLLFEYRRPTRIGSIS